MPLASAIILVAIIAAFVIFAAVLAWRDYQTRNLARGAKPAGWRTARGKVGEAAHAKVPERASL
jgi:hypothetical protein